MIKIKKQIRLPLITGILLLFCRILCGQDNLPLSLDSCYSRAIRNYPLVKQFDLIEKSKDYSISNASKGYWPQFNINGQATYQSDVTSLPISIPNTTVPQLSKDQYKIYGEISQPLTNFYSIHQQKELVKANSAFETQKIETERYHLKERINQLFFGVLLIDEQLTQTELLKKNIEHTLKKTNAAIANGIALKSNAELLRAELLKINQRTIELKAAKSGYMEMLALFIHEPLDANTSLQKPLPPSSYEDINRPEIKQYELQKETFNRQKKLLNNRKIPRLNLFFQGGYGRPALNFLTNNFDYYYVGGIRLNWNINTLYTLKKEKDLLTIKQESLDIQKETFVFNTQLSLARQNSEIKKLTELIETDKEIISLREKIRQTSQNQLTNGTITTHEYLTDVNATDQAQQNLLLHQIQLLMAQYNHQTLSGN